MKQDIFKKLEKIKNKEIFDKSWMEKGERQLLSHMESVRIPNPSSLNGQAVKGDQIMSMQASSNGLFGIFRSLSLKMQISAIVGIVALLTTGSVSAVASNSLPGDALYGWKVQVNERVGSFLAVGADSQAEYDQKILERRKEEVEYIESNVDIKAEVKMEAETRLQKQEIKVDSNLEGNVKIDLSVTKNPSPTSSTNAVPTQSPESTQNANGDTTQTRTPEPSATSKPQSSGSMEINTR